MYALLDTGTMPNVIKPSDGGILTAPVALAIPARTEGELSERLPELY